MWSKNGTPVSTSALPVPSRSSSTRTWDSLVSRSIRAVRVRGAHAVTTFCRAERNREVSGSVPALTRSQPARPGEAGQVAHQHAVRRAGPARRPAGSRTGRTGRSCAPVGTTCSPRASMPATIRSRSALDGLDGAEQLVGVGQRGPRGGLRQRGEVVRQPHELQRVDHLGRGREVAQPQPGAGEGLAHRAADHQPGVAVQQRHRGGGVAELGVGLVDHHHPLGDLADGLDDVEPGDGAGGVVRRGEEGDGRLVHRDRRRGLVGGQGEVGPARHARPSRCRCRRRAAGASSTTARTPARVRPGPPKACSTCWSTSLEPFAAHTCSSTQRHAGGAGTGTRRGRCAGRARRGRGSGAACGRPRAAASPIAATSRSDGGNGFSLTLSCTASGSCGAP